MKVANQPAKWLIAGVLTGVPLIAGAASDPETIAKARKSVS